MGSSVTVSSCSSANDFGDCGGGGAQGEGEWEVGGCQMGG